MRLIFGNDVSIVGNTESIDPTASGLLPGGWSPRGEKLEFHRQSQAFFKHPVKLCFTLSGGTWLLLHEERRLVCYVERKRIDRFLLPKKNATHSSIISTAFGTSSCFHFPNLLLSDVSEAFFKSWKSQWTLGKFHFHSRWSWSCRHFKVRLGWLQYFWSLQLLVLLPRIQSSVPPPVCAPPHGAPLGASRTEFGGLRRMPRWFLCKIFWPFHLCSEFSRLETLSLKDFQAPFEKSSKWHRKPEANMLITNTHFHLISNTLTILGGEKTYFLRLSFWQTLPKASFTLSFKSLRPLDLCIICVISTIVP